MEVQIKTQSTCSAIEDDELLTVDELIGPRWLKLPSRNWIALPISNGQSASDWYTMGALGRPTRR